MSVFHNLLQQIVKSPSLKVEVGKQVNECGDIKFSANFIPANVEGFALEVLNATFYVSESSIDISAKVRDVTFYSNSKGNEKELQEQMDALKIASFLTSSEEIKHSLRTVGNEEIQKVKNKLSKKIEDMQKKHVQLTEQSAKDLLEKMVAAVREKHTEVNANNYTRKPIKSSANVAILLVVGNGDIRRHTVRVTLGKRLAINLDMRVANKQGIIETMTKAWVANNLEIKTL